MAEDKGKVLARDFDDTCKRLFNTEDGKDFLGYLKMMHLDISSVRETTELTYYELGKKEFIEALITQVNTPYVITERALNMESTYNE